jgi:uncharacterized protein
MNNKKIINFFLFSALALLFIFFLLLISQNYQCPSCKVGESKNVRQVCFQQNCFEVEIANDDFERAQGLMYRKKLDQNKGMLFIFDRNGFYPFWMKNTLIPLDMIWLNSNKEIVSIKKNAQPCGTGVCLPIIPLQKARYVLEINAGIVDKIGLNFGNQAIFK